MTASGPLAGVDFEHVALSLGRRKVARIVVPTGAPPPRGWPTCYLLHAFGGNRNSWAAHLDLSGRENQNSMIFVLPESGRRWFINDHSGRHYEDYLLQDLLPAVDATFPTDPRPRTRLAGGFSMGGAAAVGLALAHPDSFSSAFSYAGAFFASRREGDPYARYRSSGCMMPTQEQHERVWGPPGSAVRVKYDPESILEKAVARGTAPHLFLEVGVGDYPRVVEQNRLMNAALTRAGLTHHYRECRGDHSWQFAGLALTRALFDWRHREQADR